ncbi:MAG: exonuclease domain-containing protein [candidate division Zixibacteria bacterium]|nr:exonuclease domain-containing protein [candidate division Zixibacteria bacterium]
MAHKSPSDFLFDQTFVAFDTETTGLWAQAHRIVEIGAIRFRLSSESTEVFSMLVNPQRPMPEEVIEIHGITDDMVAEAPTIDKVLPDFVRFCGDSILVAHNAPFDISFVVCELERTGLEFGKNLILDTVDIYRRLYPGLPAYSLLQLARQFNLARTQDHRAVADAALVQGLFQNAVERFPELNHLDDLRNTFEVLSMYDWKSTPATIPPGLEDLVLACDENRRVRIVYQGSGRPPSSRVIQPRSLHSLGSRSYVTAFCEQAEAERTFRLDRIQSCELLEE